MNNLFSWIKILDCTRVFSWPFATRYFADYGAEVIKIETPDFFDESRKFSPLKNWKSGYFEILNRGKKSISLDLKNNAEREIFYTLIQEVDIFVENFSPDVKNKLKIDYTTLTKINPRLIYGSINGYGENMDKRAYDVIIQAECWLASLNGEDKPMKNATSIIDTFSGTSLALAISSLLYKREITGTWGFVNVPMIACGIQLLEQNLIETSITWKNPAMVGNLDNAIFPFGFFDAKNGSISLAIGNDILWEKFTTHFLTWFQQQFISNQERLNNREQIVCYMENEFKKYNVTELISLLQDIGIPCGKINSMTDLLEEDFFRKEKYIQSIQDIDLWECTMPYEFTKYGSYPIEKYRKSPYIW
jgi:CoA:oxalate CoA-transferase